jgi:single-strand DNA-binding protein
MINRVILIGRMCFDPELRYTPSGIAVCNFRIAVDRRLPNAQGEREADFIDIVAWRQSAEFVSNYLSKGRLIAVEGRLQVRQWTTTDGQRRRTVEVVADNLRALDRPREEGERESQPAAPGGQPEPGEATPEAPDDPWHDQ